jgi:hypothetical protein
VANARADKRFKAGPADAAEAENRDFLILEEATFSFAKSKEGAPIIDVLITP